jgi:hypothetical protein
LNTTGDVVAVTTVTGTGNTQRTVTVSGLTGTGALSIFIPVGSAVDAAGNLAPSAGPSELCSVNIQAPCFIATAAYGSPFAERLTVFRDFRNDVLLKTAVGAAFVDIYYRTSPPIADQVATHPWLAGMVRAVLTPVAWSFEHPLLGLFAVTIMLVLWLSSTRLLPGVVCRFWVGHISKSQ